MACSSTWAGRRSTHRWDPIRPHLKSRQHQPREPGLGHRRAEQHPRFRRESPRQVQPGSRRDYRSTFNYNGAWVRGLSATRFSPRFPDESIRPVSATTPTPTVITSTATTTRKTTSIAASSFHPGGCNFAFARRLGPFPQGDDQHLAVQSANGEPTNVTYNSVHMPLLRDLPRESIRLSRPEPVARC